MSSLTLFNRQHRERRSGIRNPVVPVRIDGAGKPAARLALVGLEPLDAPLDLLMGTKFELQQQQFQPAARPPLKRDPKGD